MFECIFSLQAQQDQEYETQKIATIRMMYEKAANEYEVHISPPPPTPPPQYGTAQPASPGHVYACVQFTFRTTVKRKMVNGHRSISDHEINVSSLFTQEVEQKPHFLSMAGS